MRLFSVSGARHFCGSFQPIPGAAAQSFTEFHRKYLATPQLITEGQPLFDEYRSSALRDVERSIFLAASHYRRALDLMIPSSSHWAHVTLYYGAWFAARALLGYVWLRCGGSKRRSRGPFKPWASTIENTKDRQSAGTTPRDSDRFPSTVLGTVLPSSAFHRTIRFKIQKTWQCCRQFPTILSG